MSDPRTKKTLLTNEQVLVGVIEDLLALHEAEGWGCLIDDEGENECWEDTHVENGDCPVMFARRIVDEFRAAAVEGEGND